MGLRRWSRERGQGNVNRGRNTGLVWLVVLGVVLLYGPQLALALRASLTAMATILAPLVVPVLSVVAVTLLVRSYWGQN